MADSLEPGPKFIAPWADLQAGVVQAKSFGRSLALAAGVAGAAGLVTLIVTGP